MRVLSTGEKIRQLRMGIGLKQGDISNEEITRSLISMIENNKRNLTFNTAKVIAAALNKYYVNLGKEITPDLLLESEVEQAQRIIRERLNEMQQLLDKPAAGTESQVYQSFQKLIDFAQEWKLDEMVAELYEARGRYHYKTYQYNEALKDFFNAQEYHLKRENYHRVASIYNLIGISLYQLNSPEQAILYYEKAYDTIVTHQTSNYDKLKPIVLVNKALSYSKIKRYDMTFNTIKYFKESYKNEDRYYYEVLLIEANAYLDIQNYQKSKKLYEKLLKKSSKISPSLLFLIYESYADMYQRMGEYEKSISYIESAFEYLNAGSPNKVAYLYLFEARAFWKLNRVEKSYKLIEEGIIFAEKVSRKDVVVDLNLLKIQIDIDKENYRPAESKLRWLEHYVQSNNLNEKLNEIYLYFVELYCNVKDYIKCLEYTHKAQLINKVN